MRWSWRIGTVAGIDTRMHATFLLLLAWVAATTWFSASSLSAVFASLVFTLAVFGSVLLHELGHALMARRFGIGTRRITLLPIGGLAELEDTPRNPREELWIAAAGPAVNLVLAAGLGGVALVLGAWSGGLAVALVGQLVAALALANAMLGAFNMLPAFPLDGGRVLRAWLERRRGRLSATEFAVKIGKVFAVGFGAFGLVANPVLLLIAPFVWFAGERELRATRRREAQRGWVLHATRPRVTRPPVVFYWADRGS